MARPRIIKSPKQFDELAEAYFAECDSKEKPYTVTGLALGLGLSSRAALDEYEKREGFFNSVKRAKMRVENSYEESLRGKCHPSGPIFALKNFGWRDKQEIEHSGGLNMSSEACEDKAKKAAKERLKELQAQNDTHAL